MVQTFKKSLQSSSEPIEFIIDKFLINYRTTPHTSTGVSPAELTFDRKMRSRLDLLWPTEPIAAKVTDWQASQKSYHSNEGRLLSLSQNSSVSIRNYSNRGPKWIPARLQKQAGPLSYSCSLPDGRMVKRQPPSVVTPSERKDNSLLSFSTLLISYFLILKMLLKSFYLFTCILSECFWALSVFEVFLIMNWNIWFRDS